jgi:hypothetical protein
MEKTHNIISSCSRRCALAIVTAIFAAFFALAPTSEAEAGQFELGAGFGWHGQVNNHADWQGFHFMVTPGYRIVDWVGVYLDEGFGGLFWKPPVGDRVSEFAGQTVINAKFFLPVGPVELWGKVGIGAFYLAWDWGDSDWGGPAGHDSQGAFAFKLGIGCTYDVTSMIGIGGNFDYLLGAFDGGNGHYLDLQLHVRFKF